MILTVQELGQNPTDVMTIQELSDQEWRTGLVELLSTM